MARRLEVIVIAIGQGACNLVKEYNDQDRLIYLALVDCGREIKDKTLGNTELEQQMALIRTNMRERAVISNQQFGAVTSDCYLDHLIITHRDADHLNLFSNDVFFKGLTEAPAAMQKADNTAYMKIRNLYKNDQPASNNAKTDNKHQCTCWFTNKDAPQVSITSCSYEMSAIYQNVDKVNLMGVKADAEEDFAYHFCDKFTAPTGTETKVRESSYRCEHQIPAAGSGYYGTLSVEQKQHTAGAFDGYYWHILYEGTQSTAKTGGDCSTTVLLDINLHLEGPLESKFNYYLELAMDTSWENDEKPNGNIPFEYGYGEDIAVSFTVIDMLKVLELKLKNFVDSYTPVTPEYKEFCARKLESAMVAMAHVIERIRFMGVLLYTAESALVRGMKATDIINFVFGLAAMNAETLLIGQVLVGGGKPEKDKYYGDFIVNPLGYSKEFIHEVAATSFVRFDCPLYNPFSPGAYLHGLYITRMPSWYAYDDKGVPNAKIAPASVAIKKAKSAERMANENDSSLVCVFNYKDAADHEHNIVIPGDATGATMHHVIGLLKSVFAPSWRQNECIIMAPHHGSHSTSKELYRGDKTKRVRDVFFATVKPKWMFISASHLSSYGHPHKSYLISALQVLPKNQVAVHGLNINKTDVGRSVTQQNFTGGITTRRLYATAQYSKNYAMKEQHYVNYKLTFDAVEPIINVVQKVAAPNDELNLD